MDAPRLAEFSMPAEADVHERTLLAWPTERRRADLWHDLLDDARSVHATVARALAPHEAVTMLADPADAADAAARCGRGVEIHAVPLDDSWIRDSGPTIVRSTEGRRRAVHFRFNAWGRKFEVWEHDEAAGAEIADHLGIERVEAPFVLEGGSIAVDGAGLLVTTERCLLNPNRNPTMAKGDIEVALRHWLGVEEIVWLSDGIHEDAGTDGHVDNVVAFLGPRRALLQGCEDPANPNHAIAAESARRLRAAGVEVVEVPVLPYARIGGQEVPVPYVNLYLANGVMLVPTAGHAADAEVLQMLAGVTERHVEAVPGAVLAYGGGGVHCITQQVPSGG